MIYMIEFKGRSILTTLEELVHLKHAALVVIDV